MKKNIYKQMILFLIVGLLATVIDWIIYYILYSVFLVNPYVSNIISFSISVVFNYVASSKWVFNFKNKSFVPFVIFSVIGLLLNEGLLYIFLDLADIKVMLSKIFATIITMVFNYVMRKKFLENK